MKNNHTYEIDFRVDTEWFMKSIIKTDWTQDKINTLLEINKQDRILNILETHLTNIRNTLMLILPNQEEEFELESIKRNIEIQKEVIKKLQKSVTLH